MEEEHEDEWPPPGARYRSALWRAEDDDRERARKQLEHARRRLAPYLPEQEEVDLAALFELVRREVES